MNKRICHWCNEREMADGAWSGCADCPTIPYKCTCDGDTTGKPHDITCERNPSFSGERKEDPEREALMFITEDKSNEDEIWNKAILAAMRAIMICRWGMPGPYYEDVKRLLIIKDDDEYYTKYNKIVNDFEKDVFKEIDMIQEKNKREREENG